MKNSLISMTIFSFDKGEEISTHAAGGDAMVTVLEGTGRFTVGGEVFVLNAGETLIMPKDIPQPSAVRSASKCSSSFHSDRAHNKTIPGSFRIRELPGFFRAV